ncbi:MAG: DNA-directed RNA polymerase subunit alpha, partial [Anaerolineales bacterium]|nr:DNA-directed RNA polymerase subunit alpha [Anaerolineales bacterium]
MLEILNPKIEYTDGTGNYGRFSIEPLDGGFGITLGNAMRRVLLALLPGAAVTAVKIDEVEHEISTIPGIKEDTMELLLNVKEIRLRPLSDQHGRMNLEMSGQQKVHASDIISSADFEIVNPDL